MNRNKAAVALATLAGMLVLAWAAAITLSDDDGRVSIGEAPTPRAVTLGAREPARQSPSPARPTGVTGCPAAGRPTPSSQPGLDAPVASTRREIIAAAAACDYPRLGLIAEFGGQPFTFSFGEEPGAEAFVDHLEASDGATLDVLIATLDLPYCTNRVEGRVVVQWPSASCDGAGAEDWDALRALYGPKEIAEWRSLGSFTGHRVGIDADGAWLFFVAGD